MAHIGGKKIPLGPAIFDGSRSVIYKGIPHRIPPRCIEIFKLLASNLNDPVSQAALESKRIGKTDLKQFIYAIVYLFKDTDLKEILAVECVPRVSYTLKLKEILIESSAPIAKAEISPVDFSTASQRASGFQISLDSMIVNNVWELISNEGRLDEIIRRCNRTYRRCLEDFAFAIVYSSKITTGNKFRQGYNEGSDKRVAFLEQLGDLWFPQMLDDGVHSGKLLEQESIRKQIMRDFEGLSRCLEGDSWPLREWMIYDAYRHLGQHESLREIKQSSDDYLYNIESNPFYRHADLEKSLGEFATGRLAEFLRSGISFHSELYVEEALRNYVRLSVLSNVTVMHEYDVSCKGQGIYRLPHAVRCSIQRETTYDPDTQQQRVLRNLVVQHALHTAFKSVSTLDRRSLVTVLMNLRDEKPFVKMRSILEHEHLVIFGAGNSKERAAEKLIREIWYCADPDPSLKENLDFDRHRILKEVGRIPARVYEDQGLYWIFPELRPRKPQESF